MKKVSYSMITAIIQRMVTIITGFIVQRQILLAFGSSLNGLTSSIGQTMSYLVLLEAGIGSASIQALFEPLAENRLDYCNGILSATNRQYQKIGFMFSVLLVCISFVMPFVIKDDVSAITVIIMTLSIGGSSAITYLFVSKYTILYTAIQKIYYVQIIDICLATLSCGIKVAFIRKGENLVVVQAVNILIVASKWIALATLTKKVFPQVSFKEVPNNAAISKRWSVLVHQIAGLVVNRTDVMILTIFSTLKLVSLYSVYDYIYNNLIQLFSSVFSQAPMGYLGNLYHQDRKKFEKIYAIYESVYTAFLTCMISVVVVLTIPFVRLYTAGIDDALYIRPGVAILFALIAYMNLLRTPQILVINICGWFKQTQNAAILEAVINLVISLCLLPFLGIYGLLIGTIVSYSYRSVNILVFTYRNMRWSLGRFFAIFVCNVATALMFVYIAFPKLSGISTWTNWIAAGFFTTLIFGAGFAIVTIVPVLAKRMCKTHSKADCREMFDSSSSVDK